MLGAQAMRAVRVVVDIGMHLELKIPAHERYHPGETWTPELALPFVIERSRFPEDFMRSEVDRYLGWPGQAISYKVGERVWLECRADAQAAQGRRLRPEGVPHLRARPRRHGPRPAARGARARLLSSFRRMTRLTLGSAVSTVHETTFTHDGETRTVYRGGYRAGCRRDERDAGHHAERRRVRAAASSTPASRSRCRTCSATPGKTMSRAATSLKSITQGCVSQGVHDVGARTARRRSSTGCARWPATCTSNAAVRASARSACASPAASRSRWRSTTRCSRRC